jgi:hypothetical protein
MAMTRDELVDSIGGSAPPRPKVDKRSFRTAGAKGPPAPSRWIRSLSDYDRHERREYQVSRYG